ncbi:MAG: hypothetical protein M1834_001474 [Cirrosporium novae-zelandiae]|nr:MAG: hypothetical protein M1834_008620 [Cirrosporium novae-zelandiae]KAI9736008.1 MAG: hypothetical protein M1834_001474 [Cirrosporium novae-zelandiae]
MANFDHNAMLRGAQLTLVGAFRALQNPDLFTSQHYRQAAIAVCVGIAIRLIIAIPLGCVKVILKIIGLVLSLEDATWDDNILNGLDFIAYQVLQVPFFLMTLMRYVTPTLDQMFMDSLAWVDRTYYQKHESEDSNTLRAKYYDNLKMYPTHAPPSKDHKSPMELVMASSKVFLYRFAKRAGISLAVYLLSFVPVVGRFVLPAASFYTFRSAVGDSPAVAIFGTGLFLPRRYLVRFLQSYFASRSLMRELLEPYFARIRFNQVQKRRWFRDREGVLFGFGVGFYVLVKIPLLGVLIYGIAEASTAYLVTKITDPPPPPAEVDQFKESQVEWKNKHEFLKLPIAELDSQNMNISKPSDEPPPYTRELPDKKFS